jgi:hypothetical protein
MNIETFLKGINKKSKDYNDSNELFRVPKGDKKDDIPHIKNNISDPNYLQQADILYLPTSQFGYKYALVVVDVATSKMDAIPLKNKTPQDIITALKKVYITHNILEFPFILQFDNCSEFKGDLKKYLDEQGVSVRYTKTNRHRQNAVVEARNKVLGELVLKFQAMKELETKKKTTEWHKYIDDFVAFINTKSITPNPINMSIDILGNTKKKSDDIEILSLNQKVRKILDYPVNAHDNKKTDSKFRVGDIRWSKDIYLIKHIILNPNMPPMYMVNKLNHEDKIDNTVAYTINQLLKVKN